jgi:uncharacterized protein (TIGR02145 family)
MSILKCCFILLIISLVITSCKKDKNDEDQIQNNPPVASFTVTPTTGNTSATFNFDASASHDDNDPLSSLKFRWDWENDGNWDTQFSNDPTSTHQYGTEGDYTIKLLVQDTEGLSGMDTRQVTVTNPPFQCGDLYPDPRDGQEYETVQFGSKCWMAKNLNYGNMINGNLEQTDNGEIEKYCYDNEEANCNTYGGLYQWNELMQYSSESGSQGICPAGWHPATLEEWQDLEMELGMSQEDATTPTGWVGTDQGQQLQQNAFNALLGGYRNTAGAFIGITYTTRFWTSTESNSYNAWIRSLQSDKDQIRHDYSIKEYGCAVRCVKD